MAKTNREQSQEPEEEEAPKQQKNKHLWQPDELRALYLLYGHFGLSCSGPMKDDTDEATRLMNKLFNIDSSKKGTKTNLYRSMYKERNQAGKGSKWDDIIRGPNEKNKAFYDEDDLDAFRDVKRRIEDAAEELDITLQGDDTKGPFAYSEAEALNAAVDAVRTPSSSEHGQEVEKNGDAED
ncbi:uncharacterized protein MYCFIDRAFT_83978 [Pseudocercospora fijiensis CIRAD86]|uniref:Uncharacterized protein n=1 Tax=Pseudocercospora fijiensis (strain CIRAD86) TaxID=383855 RepID=M2ZCP0_PSEFD|nr:uncharacterized protein MYCFIDRAFT_83978 [Pseudocercospora fijiensis CIRAD86]EME76879.1 hypothetical protein MYCFIDRAFT_83978 [Pseudocercospora fijiensis CIRAD86]